MCSRSLTPKKIGPASHAAHDAVDCLPEVHVDHAVQDEVDGKVGGLHEVGDGGAGHVHVVVVVAMPAEHVEVPDEFDDVRGESEHEEEHHNGDQSRSEAVTGCGRRLVSAVHLTHAPRLTKCPDEADVAEGEHNDRKEHAEHCAGQEVRVAERPVLEQVTHYQHGAHALGGARSL